MNDAAGGNGARKLGRFVSLIRDIAEIDKKRIAVKNVLERIKHPRIAIRVDPRYRSFYLVSGVHGSSRTHISFIMNLKSRENEIRVYDSALAERIRLLQLADETELKPLYELESELNKELRKVIDYIRVNFKGILAGINIKNKEERQDISTLLYIILMIAHLIELIGENIQVNGNLNELGTRISTVRNQKRRKRLEGRLERMREAIIKEAEIYFLKKSIGEIRVLQIDEKTIVRYPSIIKRIVDVCRHFEDEEVSKRIEESDVINHVRFYIAKLRFIYNIKSVIERGKRQSGWEDFFKLVRKKNIKNQSKILAEELRDKELGNKLLEVREKWREFPGDADKGQGWHYEISLMYRSLYNEQNRIHVAKEAKTLLENIIAARIQEISDEIRNTFAEFVRECINIIKEIIEGEMKAVEKSVKEQSEGIINFVKEEKASADRYWDSVKREFTILEESLDPANEIMATVGQLSNMGDGLEGLPQDTSIEVGKISDMMSRAANLNLRDSRSIVDMVKTVNLADKAASRLAIMQECTRMDIEDMGVIVDGVVARDDDIRRRFNEVVEFINRSGLDRVVQLAGGVPNGR